MTTFSTFSNILPDPLHPITDAGDFSISGSPGPGFAAVNFQSVRDSQTSRTISGRGVLRDGSSQHWEFTISYNRMFRALFDPIDSFLDGRNPRTDPFFVALPQYLRPKDPIFAAFALANTINIISNPIAGSNKLLISHAGSTLGAPKPGDMFTIIDPADFNHKKVYKVVGVETPTYYQAATTPPAAGQFRIHITPPLQRSVLTNPSVINFIKPLFRVITKSDTHEYTLDTENLYSLNLPVEEMQP